MRLLSGVTVTAVTHALCPFNVFKCSPHSRSHIFKVLSYDADMRRRPSGVTATAVTTLVCPSIVRIKALPAGLRQAVKGRSHLPRLLLRTCSNID